MKEPKTFKDVQELAEQLKDKPVEELRILAYGMSRTICTYFVLILHDTYGIELSL